MAEPFLSALSQCVSSLRPSTWTATELEVRHFFSGAALYANGKICASLTPVGLGIKLPASDRERLIARGEGTELRYFDRAPVKKGYVLLPASVLDDEDAAKKLLEASLRHLGFSA